MDNYNEKLNRIVEKSKPNKNDIENAVILLSKLLTETNDYSSITVWLLKMNFHIAELFFDKNSINDENAKEILTALSKHEPLKGKIKGFLFDRLFVIGRVFLKEKIDKKATADLFYIIIKYGSSKNGYATNLLSSFNKFIVNRNYLTEFLQLPDYADNSNDKRIISEFIKFAVKENEEKEPSLPKSNPAQPKTKSTQTTNKKTAENPKLDLGDYSKKLTEQLDRLIKINDTISMLKLTLNDKDKEIQQLKQELEISQSKTLSLEIEKSELNKKLSLSEEKQIELDERLKSLYKMDNSIRDQEMQTLKKNVADALKMEYTDFKESDQTVNEDNFIANYASLDRIFRILTRFGFNLEG